MFVTQTLIALSLVTLLGSVGAAGDFVLAADMSALPTLADNYRWSSADAPTDPLFQLKRANFTHVRLRTWVQPIPSQSYCNLTGLLQMAARVHAVNLQIWLDFHFSDTWADPGHQHKPAAWASLGFSDLVGAVSNYTATVLQALLAQNTPPAIVQIGNEVQNGLLWPAANQSCTDSGALYPPECNDNSPAKNGPPENWSQFAALLQAGSAAARHSCPQATVMIHMAASGSLASDAGAAYVAQFYAWLEAAGVDFDAAGLSLYPQYGLNNMSDLQRLRNVSAALPRKQLFCAETAYAFSSSGGQPPMAGFAETPAGQAAFWSTFVQEAQQVKLRGAAWWGTEYVGASTALWDPAWVALPALKVLMHQ